MIPLPAGPRRLAATALVAVAWCTGAARAQSAGPPRYTFGWGDAVSVGGGAALAGIGLLLTPPPASCAPCDRATLPGIDRWTVDFHSRAAARASDVLLLAVVGAGAYASTSGTGAARARGDAAVFGNATVWTAAATQFLKRTFHRARPALYRSSAVQAATESDNRLGFPSGHASVAFAAATAYATLAARQHLSHARRNSLLLYAGATGVGTLRVVAGKHFPTDVLGGAALGAVVGWVVARVHPTTP